MTNKVTLSSPLGVKQRLFTKLIAQLILYAYDIGEELSFGDAYRDPRVHGEVGVKKSYSSANSVHKHRLAVDLNLTTGGTYKASTEDHRRLGEYWEKLHPLCRWGGRFNDGNHYSFEHQGAK